jgi:superfamily II DNA helicase RecQ
MFLQILVRWGGEMPFRFFVISLTDSGDAAEELNGFLGSHRVVHIDRRWLDQGSQSAWAFCVEYVVRVPSGDSFSKTGLSRNRIDYKTILSPEEFTLFSQLRELRKEWAQQEAVPVYALFNNEQLAQMIQRRCVSKSELLAIEGIGEAKVEKYAERLLVALAKSSEPVPKIPGP